MANPLWEGHRSYIEETRENMKQLSEFFVTSGRENKSDSISLDELTDKQEELDFNPRELDLTEVEPFCNLCGQTFKLKEHFKNHMVQKHKYDPTNIYYKCSCNQKFYEQKASTKHQKVVEH